MYIVFAIIAFGVLIFVHELGHFMAAKACGVKVTEFALGMGPKLLHKQGKETLYSLRMLPIGGFCAMEGEDEASEDPRAFSNQSIPRRLLILAAGSAMNFLTGFLLLLILYAGFRSFPVPVIHSFAPDCPYEETLQAGDEIRRVNGKRIYFRENFVEYADMDADGNLDLELRRDGKRLLLKNYRMVPMEEYPAEDGGAELKYGIHFGREPANVFTTLKYTWYNCLEFVRMVWRGLGMLFSGQAAVSDMSGPVGIVDVINEVGKSAENVSQGLRNASYLVAFIAVNLAVMNMLPIPALDGGHILTLLAVFVIEKLTGKKPDPRIEGYIHFIGLILLLGLMALVLYNDIARIVAR